MKAREGRDASRILEAAVWQKHATYRFVSILGSRLVATLVDPADTVYQLDDQTKAKKFVGRSLRFQVR